MSDRRPAPGADGSEPDGSQEAAARPISLRSARLSLPAVVIHGGAGSFPRPPSDPRHALELEGLRAALSAAWAVLSRGGPALDAVVEAVASMENDGTFNAGRGAVPTTAGTVETDAAVMDGATATFGAICAATWPASPVRAASALASRRDTLMLAGAGADRFAADSGLEQRDPASLTRGGEAPVADLGTVGAVAVDSAGHVAAATSTGGRPNQRPGRVGDTPVLGAGTWARDETAAVSATGIGEAFVLAGFAHRVDWQMRAGATLEEAARTALEAVAHWDGTGGAVLIDKTGAAVVLCDTPAMARGWRHAAGELVEVYAGGAAPLGAEDSKPGPGGP